MITKKEKMKEKTDKIFFFFVGFVSTLSVFALITMLFVTYNYAPSLSKIIFLPTSTFATIIVVIDTAFVIVMSEKVSYKYKIYLYAGALAGSISALILTMLVFY